MINEILTLYLLASDGMATRKMGVRIQVPGGGVGVGVSSGGHDGEDDVGGEGRGGRSSTPSIFNPKYNPAPCTIIHAYLHPRIST